MKTKEDIRYHGRVYNDTIIPAGTPVIPATNLPEGPVKQYWAEPWENMSEEEQSWMRNYGFLLEENEVDIS